ncbi:MAG: hypothetical protein BWX45_00923 [Deltaproteobacteria bacterium ADurb.Bin002]|nr:MAG: hypothetical protein BWX45_00923 [Deltaproteobacteria bacterium ADurb.Bin002]
MQVLRRCDQTDIGMGQPADILRQAVKKTGEHGFQHAGRREHRTAVAGQVKCKIPQFHSACRGHHRIGCLVNPIIGKIGKIAQAEKKKHLRVNALRPGNRHLLLELAPDVSLFDFPGNQAVETPVHQPANAARGLFIVEKTQNQTFMLLPVGWLCGQRDLHVFFVVSNGGHPGCR